MKNLIIAMSLTFLPSIPAMAVDFDECTNRLYAVGGMSKTDAMFACYKNVPESLLDCQNKKFLIDFMNPNEAFNSCLRYPETTYFDKSNLYRGSYEATPPRDGRKTVCSITINSTEEREAFRKELNPNEYSWVELLPFNRPENQGRFMVRDNQWLKRSCEKKIRCDILVFSGHFASSFIGSSGYEVKLEDLTKFSCDQNCKELFDSVKQVYLFGCNTLATNAADSRTISQYVEILIEDGVAPHQAQRIAARRYTTYNQTIRNEFRKVFPRAEQLFGFASTGPTGKNIKHVLTQYLRNFSRIDENNKAEHRANFVKTLGKVGMMEIGPLPRDAKMCMETTSVLRADSLKNKAGLALFISKYGSLVPVAAIDLIAEAKENNYISAIEQSELINSVFKRFDKSPLAVKRHLLCPILATSSYSILPKSLSCLETLGKPGDKNSWATAKP